SQTLVTVLLVVWPSLALVARSGASASLHVVAFVGLVCMLQASFQVHQRNTVRAFWAEYGLLSVALLSPLIASMLSHTVSGNISEAFSTTVQRAAFGVFALYALLQCSRAALAHVQWGILAGTASAALVLFIDSGGGAVRPSPD